MKLKRRMCAALFCIPVALPIALSAMPAAAEDVSFGASQLCGLDTARPDHSGRVRKETIQGRNGPLSIVRFGHGSPLLLITGYRATLGEWNAYFLGELARHHEVITFDNRGVGRSSTVQGRYGPNYDIHDMADDAADVIAALGFARVDVVGWSMGGMIAQQLALDAPEKVESLTLIGTAPSGPQAVPIASDVQAVLSSHGANAFADIMNVLFPADAVADAKRCFVADMFAPRGYTNPAVPDTVAAQQADAMRGWFADSSSADALRRSPVRTLVVAGDNDTVLPDSNADRLREIIPRASLDRIADAGHALMFQYPIELARRIDSFVGR